MIPLQTKTQNAFDMIDALYQAKEVLPQDADGIEDLIQAFVRMEFHQSNLDKAKVYLEKMVQAAGKEITVADQEYEIQMKELERIRKELADLDRKGEEQLAAYKKKT